MDMGLYYPNSSNGKLIGYADAGYLSDPHKARSQTGYLFTCGDIIAIHEASRKCIWLRNLTQPIRNSCGLTSNMDAPTILYEDNAACVAQFKEGFIKGDRTKHISPKFFFTQKECDINIQKIQSCNNLADLFTKSLPTSKFEKMVRNIGMRRFKEIK